MTTAPYLLTASGQRYRLTGPELDAPRIADIAHHLAQINRFTGAASRPYSVAEHSLLCEQIAASEGADPMARLCALMHDAHEAYASDMASPAKVAMRMNWDAEKVTHDSHYDQLEYRHHFNMAEAFGLRPAFRENFDSIRRWDLIALATERAALMPQDDGEGWAILDGIVPFHGYQFCKNRIWPWNHWRDEFLEKYTVLRAMCWPEHSL